MLKNLQVAAFNLQYLSRSGMAGFLSFICTSTRLSPTGMSRTCHCLPSRSLYSFTDPEGTEC